MNCVVGSEIISVNVLGLLEIVGDCWWLLGIVRNWWGSLLAALLAVRNFCKIDAD